MTSRYLGSKISGSQQWGAYLSNDDSDGKEKNNRFILAKQLPCPLHDCSMKLPNFTRQLYGVDEDNTKIFILFLYT